MDRTVMDTLSTAIEWYDRGISTIPCYPSSKRLLKDTRVRDYYHKLVDFSHLIDWFGDDYFNIALVTMNGLCVLDFDNIIDYVEWLDKYQLNTRTVETKRGVHAYFWIDEPVLPYTCEYAEIKCNGAHLMIPSSRIGDFQYQVIEEKEIQRRESIREICDVLPQRKEERRTAIPSSDLSSLRCGNDVLSRIKNSFPMFSYLADFQPIKTGDRWYMSFCPAHNDINNRSLSINYQLNLARCFNQRCLLSRRWYDVPGLHSVLNNLTMSQSVADLSRKLEVRIN